MNLKVSDPAFISNSYLTLQKAVVAGEGSSMLPVPSVLKELRDGELIPVLDAFAVPPRSLYAIYAPGRYTLTRVRLLLDFVAEWFREHPIERPSPLMSLTVEDFQDTVDA